MPRAYWGASHLFGLHDPRAAAVPDLERVRELLLAYIPPDPDQAATRVRMLSFLLQHPDALHRSCLAGHFTASALVLAAEGERALLTHHRKLDAWLQLGGHCDGDGNLPAVALREATEESGLPDLEIDPRPIDLDVHTIPTRPGEPEHLHLDTRFLVYAPPGARPARNHESHELRWVALDELPTLATDDSVRRLFRYAFELE